METNERVLEIKALLALFKEFRRGGWEIKRTISAMLCSLVPLDTQSCEEILEETETKLLLEIILDDGVTTGPFLRGALNVFCKKKPVVDEHDWCRLLLKVSLLDLEWREKAWKALIEAKPNPEVFSKILGKESLKYFHARAEEAFFSVDILPPNLLAKTLRDDTFTEGNGFGKFRERVWEILSKNPSKKALIEIIRSWSPSGITPEEKENCWKMFCAMSPTKEELLMFIKWGYGFREQAAELLLQLFKPTAEDLCDIAKQ